MEQDKLKDFEKQDEELDLATMLRLIKENIRVLLLITAIVTLTSIVLAFTLKKIYRSEVVFQQENSDKNSDILKLAGIAELVGMNLQNDQEDFTVILESRTFRENIAKKLDLLNYYIKLKKSRKKKLPNMQDVTEWMEEDVVTVYFDSKKDLYTVRVELPDRKKAVEIANSYYSELENYIAKKRVTKSKKTVDYVEKQLDSVRGKISLQEAELRELEKKYQTVAILEEASELTKVMGELKAQIVYLDAKLQLERAFTGEKSLSVQKLAKQIEIARDELKALQEGGENLPVNLIPLKDIPEVKSKLLKLEKELTASYEIYKMLLLQKETSKLESISEESTLNIVDLAIIPDEHVRPKRLLMVVMGFTIGILMGLIFIFSKEFIKNSNK